MTRRIGTETYLGRKEEKDGCSRWRKRGAVVGDASEKNNAEAIPRARYCSATYRRRGGRSRWQVGLCDTVLLLPLDLAMVGAPGLGKGIAGVLGVVGGAERPPARSSAAGVVVGGGGL